MKYFSTILNIKQEYINLLIMTLLCCIFFEILKKIGIKILRNTKDNKKEYIYTQKYKLIITVFISISLLLIWTPYIKKMITLISVLSAAFTIALRDLIFNFFCGLYIKIVKPFVVEDRIEINNYKGDVININTLNFEVLEVNNENFIGQSTGVITHIPNSTIFSYPLRNYNKAFKYIWNEINVSVPLNSDISKTKSIIYRIVNSNEIIKEIPKKMKNQINNISNNYRIYYNKYDPIIYTKVVDNHIELTVRYLIHPKKARFVNSTIWNNIIEAYQNNEIELYQ